MYAHESLLRSIDLFSFEISSHFDYWDLFVEKLDSCVEMFRTTYLQSELLLGKRLTYPTQ